MAFSFIRSLSSLNFVKEHNCSKAGFIYKSNCFIVIELTDIFRHVFIIDFLCAKAKKSITFNKERNTLFSNNKNEFSKDIFSKTATINSRHAVSSIEVINVIILGIAPIRLMTEVNPGFISNM